jgi:hypothetical protein
MERNMKNRIGILCGLAVLAATATIALTAAAGAASPGDEKWVGVWQGKLDGVPAVELTIGNDTGEVDGTIVFHRVIKDGAGPRADDTEPHTLIHPHMDGDRFVFQVKRGNGSDEILNMTVELTSSRSVKFACSNCGPAGTTADLERVQ